MQTIKTVLILLLVFGSNLHAQTIERLYTDPLYDYISLDVAPLPDGSFFVLSAVKHKDSTDYKTVNLTRLNKKGDYEGTSYDYYLDEDGELLIAPEGSIEVVSENELLLSVTSADSENPTHAIIKVGFNGIVKWTKTIKESILPTTNNERNRLSYFLSDSTTIHYGSSVIGASTPYIYLNYLDYFGNSYQGDLYTTIDGKICEIGNISQARHDGSYVFCGMIGGNFFVTKLDTNNIPQWSNTYNDSLSSDVNGNAIAVVQMASDFYIAAYNQYDNDGIHTGYITRIDSAGSTVWTKKLTYPTNTHCEITGLVAIDDSKFAVAIKKEELGKNGVSILTTLDTAGIQLWEKQYKPTFNVPTVGDQLVKSSANKLVYLTTGYDTTVSTKRPLRYLISANLDGSTDCNNDVSDLSIDSIAIGRDTLIWTVNDAEDYIDANAWRGTRTTIPYSIYAANGKSNKYCPDEIIDTHLIGTAEGAISYLWNKDNNMTDSLKVGPKSARELSSEQYIIEVKVLDKYCYTLCDTFQFDTVVKEKIILDVQDNFCINKTNVIRISNFTDVMLSTVMWSNGETGVTSITVSESGNYSVSALDGCSRLLSASQSVTLAAPQISPIDVRIDTSFYCDTFLVGVVLANADKYISYKWSNGKTESSIIVTPGEYSITVSDGCTELTKNIIAPKAASCPNPLQWPDAFTPTESDDIFIRNKTFGPYIRKEVDLSSYNLVIVNRWGQVVFESDEVDKRWNGTYNNKKAIGGTYFYKAVYTIESGTIEEKGGVYLVR